MDFEEVADELYGLVPEAFTTRRNEWAADAKEHGDRALAERLRQLRRPAASAWLSNLLVRERPTRLGELLELGAPIRDAQLRLAGDDLRRLARRRQELVAALTGEAEALAGERNQRVTEAQLAELQGTLEAALSDEDLAGAVRSGRLTRPLHSSGLAFPAAAPGDTRGGPARREPAAARRAGRASRGRPDRLDEARAALDQAVRAAEEASNGTRQAEEVLEHLRRRIADSEARLAVFREDEHAAQHQVDRWHKQRDAALEAKRQAQHELSSRDPS